MPTYEDGLASEQIAPSQDSFTGGLHVHAFPHGEGSWRIDWFGEIFYPDPYDRNRQPSVAVYLSNIAEEPTTDKNTVRFERFEDSGQTNTNAQRRVMVSIGTLTILRIGDIWKNGRLIERPESGWQEFEDVSIERETTSLIKAGLSLQDSGFLLPLSEHLGHLQCTQSYCLMVNLPEEKRLIIPCMELIRFYFGTSSKLLTSLFTPPLNLNSLFLDARFHRDSKHLWILLAENMSAMSAPDVGRLHLSDVALRSAKHVGASIMKVPVHTERIYPQSFFPFEGKTTLKAMGQWLSFAGKPNRTFLVFRLILCSHPFPFNSLRYEIEGKGTSSPYRPGSKNKSQNGGGDDDLPVVEQDASRKFGSTSRMAWEDQRFLDLKGKNVWKGKEITSSNQIGRRSTEPLSGMAFGDPGSTRQVRPFEVISGSFMDTQSKLEVPTFLQDILIRLEALHANFPKVRIELLTESENDGWTVALQYLNESRAHNLAERGEPYNQSESSYAVQPQQCGDQQQCGSIAERPTSVFLFTELVAELDFGLPTRDPSQICMVLVDNDPRFMKLYSVTGLDKVAVWKLLERVPSDICTWLENRNPSQANDFVDDLVERGMIEIDAWCSQVVDE